MIKTKRRNTYIAFVFAGILVMLGITLASALSITRSTDVDVYPVILNTNVDFVEDLQEVVNGDTIVNSVTLERTTDSKDIFVRADLHYYKYGSLSDADKRFLLAINYDDISTYEGTSYKWVRAEDGYYYLTDLDGIPLKITDNTRYTFCEGVTYQGAKCINNDTPAPLDLKLDVTIQAINAKNVTTTTLDETATLFNSNYTPRPVMGYIVAFDTGDAGAVPAQTFFVDGQKVTEPPEPIKIGYEFKSWYTDSDYSEGSEYDFNATASSSFTLYAKFDALPTFSIKFISEGLDYAQYELVQGSSINEPINPTKTNYIFLGWSLDSVNVVDLSDILVTEDMTFIAVYKATMNGTFSFEEYTLVMQNNMIVSMTVVPISEDNKTSDGHYSSGNGWVNFELEYQEEEDFWLLSVTNTGGPSYEFELVRVI